mmetsp:Transcript_41541/g.101941  ORF Transcript_41541/g.101941 Transcript_41541/m.101941 type:complete len:407 (+) Transcript_41541:381-1601(+)
MPSALQPMLSFTASDISAFEGSEKKMEINWVPADGSEASSLGWTGGLRTYGREHWESVVALLNGTILLHSPEDKMDVYLISESSLFVYADRVIILTCGTTTLLKTLGAILESAEKVGLEVSYFQYSRKNFLFPEQQEYPHTSFDQECHYMSQLFDDGHPYVFGPLTGDHWYVFVADRISRTHVDGTPRDGSDRDQTLNIYMYDIDPVVAQLFMRADPLIIPTILQGGEASNQEEGGANNNIKKIEGGFDHSDYGQTFSTTSQEATERSGIAKLIPDGAVVHDHLFEPCGYSMNGRAAGDAYWTIHITPEAHCSYASFETNYQCDGYADLIRRVVAVFNPSKFTTVEHVDCASSAGAIGPQCPANVDTYRVRGRTLNEFCGKAYSIQMCNYGKMGSGGESEAEGEAC